MAGQNNNKKFLIQFSYVSKIPMLIIKSMGNDSNIINSVFTIFFIPPPALNDNFTFPDGIKFYPDVQNGVRGYNTDAARGADTFHPFYDSSDHIKFYGRFVQGTYTINLDDNSFFYINDSSSNYRHITDEGKGTLHSLGNQSITYVLSNKILTLNVANASCYIFGDSDVFPS